MCRTMTNGYKTNTFTKRKTAGTKYLTTASHLGLFSRLALFEVFLALRDIIFS